MTRTLLVLALTTVACADAADLVDPAAAPVEGVALRFTRDLTAAETDAVMELVNTASFEVLDVDVGLDSRAARGIVDARPLADLDALDAVPYVGDSALDKLYAYADAMGMIVDEPVVVVFGIEEGSETALAILSLVNLGSLGLLDDGVGLDSRAAANIVSARASADIASLEALDAISYVGATAFEHLAAYVAAHPIVDGDGDAFLSVEDCDDAAAAVHPGATERCDGLDTDCDPGTGEDGLVTDETGRNYTSLGVAIGTGRDIAICPGTYTGVFDLEVHQTLEGIGDREAIVLEGGFDVGAPYGVYGHPAVTLRNFEIHGDGTGTGVHVQRGDLHLDGMRLTGFAHAAIAWEAADLTIDDSVIDGNTAPGSYGAGVWYGSKTTGAINDSVLSGNAGAKGAALYVDSSEIKVSRSELTGNTGGAIYVRGTSVAGATLRVVSSDLGLGDTDNSPHDVEVAHTTIGRSRTYASFGDSESFTCRAYEAYSGYVYNCL